jgi:hypothetical protein
VSRIFTVEEANRTLPLVSRIVEDIVRDYARWREKVEAYELEVARTPRGATNEEATRLERDAQQLAVEIERFLDELSSLGAQFKGFDLGLVDFPAELAGRQVCLCWRLGEPQVEHWHEVDAGFAGRQPLSQMPEPVA